MLQTVTESQIAAWAEEGVEQRAGKSWVQLDAERMLRSEAEMNASLCAVLSFPPPRILCPKVAIPALFTKLHLRMCSRASFL